MKAFISQPMKGLTDEQILAERSRAIHIIKSRYGKDVEILETFFGPEFDGKTPLHFLAKSLEYLAEADLAFFCEGWEAARGCKIERLCAVEYGITIIGE